MQAEGSDGSGAGASLIQANCRRLLVVSCVCASQVCAPPAVPVTCILYTDAEFMSLLVSL